MESGLPSIRLSPRRRSRQTPIEWILTPQDARPREDSPLFAPPISGLALRRARIFALALAAGIVVLGIWEAAFRPATVGARPALQVLIIPGDRKVAIVRSEASDRCIGAAEFGRHADHWLELVGKGGYKAETIGDAQLESGLDAYAAVILPSVICLGDPARAELERYLRAGGGVIATWALGARDRDGSWRGYDFLQSLTGALRFELGAREAPWFVSVRSASPLGAGLPGGTRVQVTSLERLEATALDADAFWSDAGLRPRDPELPADYQAAIVRKQVEEGRLVWLGFHENSSVTGEADRASAILLNGLAWAARRPMVAVDPWPSPFTRSTMVAVDVSEFPDRARRLALELAQARVPATFFIDPALAGDGELVRELRSAGELALKWQHTNEGGRGRHALDRVLMDWARLVLWSRTFTWARGVRPSGDTLDQPASEFLAEAGVRYTLAAGGVDSVLPVARSVRRPPSMGAQEGSIISLGRSADDDLHLSPLGLEGLESEWIVKRLMDDSDSVGRLGGLYVLSLHTQGLGGPEYVPALRAVLARIAASNSWVARGGDIAGWWSSRSRLRLSLASPSASALRVDITSEASRPLENAALVVYPGVMRGTPQARLSPEGPPPHVVADPVNGRVRVDLPRLEPGRRVSLDITFVR